MPHSPPQRSAHAKKLVDLTNALDGWGEPAAFGVGADGEVLVAARRPTEESLRVEKGLGIFPKSALERPVDVLVLRHAAGETTSLVVPEVAPVVSFLQPTPDGVLLVAARCHWTPRGAEHNALLVDPRGAKLRSFALGDGIADVRVTRAGDIWVSFFDEGIFGNYGWSSPGPPAMGAAGLVRFDASGRVAFSYDAEAAETDSICDAYATNVEPDGTVWSYFYTEFPLVRIRDGQYRAWPLGEAGARSLAVRSGGALLVGDYQDRDLGRVVELRERARVVERVRIVDDEGESLAKSVARGVGEKVFFLRDRTVFVLEEW